jgi:hypothetical protein
MIFLIVAMKEWFHYWNHSVKSLRNERLSGDSPPVLSETRLGGMILSSAGAEKNAR